MSWGTPMRHPSKRFVVSHKLHKLKVAARQSERERERRIYRNFLYIYTVRVEIKLYKQFRNLKNSSMKKEELHDLRIYSGLSLITRSIMNNSCPIEKRRDESIVSRIRGIIKGNLRRARRYNRFHRPWSLSRANVSNFRPGGGGGGGSYEPRIRSLSS